MKLQKKLLAFVLLAASFLYLPPVSAPVHADAPSFTLIKTAASPDMYVRLSIGKYKVRDQDTWNRWGFTWDMVHVVSDSEMAAIPRGPDLTQAMRPFGQPTVYVVENAQVRAVTSADAFLLAGYNFAQVSDVESVIINLLPHAVNLDIPPVVRSPSDGAIYYLSGGQKHHIVSADVWNQWGFTGYRDSAYVNTIPTGSPLTKLVQVQGDPTVWVVDHAKRRALPSPDALLLNNLSWADLGTVDASLLATLPIGDIFYAPTTVQIPGSSQNYFVLNGKLYPIADSDTASAWGLSRFASSVSPAAASYPVGPKLTRLPRTEDGTVWRVTANTVKSVPSAGIFAGYGFNWADVTDIPAAAFSILTNAGSLSYITDTLNGYTIPATSGIAGLEQHIWTTNGENSEADHYALTSTPTQGQFLTCSTGSPGCIRNGVAGTGAFGRIDPSVEEWYIAMRWNYCTWAETAAPDSFGQPSTTCTSTDSTAKTWHKYKKVIVTNPKNGRKIVAAVGEAGPAIWVTRQQGVTAGLSPEGIDYLQAKHNTGGDSLLYGWAADQTLPLGPLTL
jgi:hypothetical protein